MDGARVLVVEDDVTLGGGLRQALASQGYRASWVQTGAEALELARDPHDLVLLDLKLPDMDGVQVCRRLRAAQPWLVIVMLTARRDEIDVIVGLDAGADDYLTKPFRLAELLARIRAHTRRLESAGPAGLSHQQGEQVELLGTHVELAPGQPHPAGGPVQLQIADDQPPDGAG